MLRLLSLLLTLLVALASIVHVNNDGGAIILNFGNENETITSDVNTNTTTIENTSTSTDTSASTMYVSSDMIDMNKIFELFGLNGGEWGTVAYGIPGVKYFDQKELDKALIILPFVKLENGTPKFGFLVRAPSGATYRGRQITQIAITYAWVAPGRDYGAVLYDGRYILNASEVAKFETEAPSLNPFEITGGVYYDIITSCSFSPSEFELSTPYQVAGKTYLDRWGYYVKNWLDWKEANTIKNFVVNLEPFRPMIYASIQTFKIVRQDTTVTIKVKLESDKVRMITPVRIHYQVGEYMPDGTFRIIAEGNKRVITDVHDSEITFNVTVKPLNPEAIRVRTNLMIEDIPAFVEFPFTKPEETSSS